MSLLIKTELLLILFLVQVYPQDPEALHNRIDKYISSLSILDRTNIALDVYDLTDLRPVYSLNNKLLLHPASNMKLLTSAAGLIFLNNYEFRTSIFYTGEILNGRLSGDIYIRGGCDPFFSLSDIDTLVTYLRSEGIKEITGNIYGDISFKDDLFWGRGWMWDDDPVSDAPYLSALNLNNNLVTVYANISAGGKPEVRTEPSSSYFTIINKLSVSNDSDNIYITRDWQNRTNTITVTGSLNSSVFTERVKRLNVFDPASYFLTFFRERLINHLIIFEGSLDYRRTPSFAREIYTVNRSFESLLPAINKSSNNLASEMVLFALAGMYYPPPASAVNGLLMVDSLLKLSGIKSSSRLADGSGVSHYNLVTAEQIISVLKYIYFQHPAVYEKFYASLSVAGKDGTLRNRMQGTAAEGRVYGKTGTLTGVSCLSGYAATVSGNMIAFSIMIQNFTGEPASVRLIQDEICKILAEYK